MIFKIQKGEMIGISDIKARRFPIISKKRIQTRAWLMEEEDRNIFRALDMIGCSRGCIMIWIEDECPVRCPLFLHVLFIRVKKVTMKLARELYLRMST